MMIWCPIWSSNDTRSRASAIVVNTASKAALLASVEDAVEAGQGFTLATLNLDHVVKLRRDQAFRAAYVRHSHVVADGNPIVWLERLAGRPVELVPGSELIDPVAAIAARRGVPVAFLGSTELTLKRAARELEARHPDLRVVRRIAPVMGFDPRGPDAEAAIAELSASGARLCFVALGAPRQEIFAAHAAESLPGTGFLSIGAGLDFVAGAQTRAPRWVRALAAEWLWRLASHPGRLAGRYALCLSVLPPLVVSSLRHRASRAGGASG